MKRNLLIVAFMAIILNCQGQVISKWKIDSLQSYINRHQDEVLVINFWATFCKPCVAEIPHFISVVNQLKDQKVRLLLVSLDLPSQYPDKIAAFAKKNKFTAAMSWLDETNADYFCPKVDSSWSGSIPATLILHPATGYRSFFEEEMSREKLEAEIRKAYKK